MESGPKNPGQIEPINLREQARRLPGAQILGILGLVGAVGLGYMEKDEFRTFFNSYLIAYMFILAIALGGLFFTLLQHATKAGWSVNVRRIAEWFGSSLPIMTFLSVPILAAVLMGKGALYPWAVTAWATEHEGTFKGLWLSPDFFVVRGIVSLLLLSAMGVWYFRQSLKQDDSGDIRLTLKMQYWAPLCLVVFGLALTCLAWDWIMSLDPVWYSTIFGVYYFAGSTLTMFASIILTVRFLQARGLLVKSVTTEHFHDLGKFLFAFVFFWGYIGFSQFMLQWYGNIPDETGWFLRHGASTHTPNDFSPVLITLLFGHFLIPFPGLLSRHMKRAPGALAFWAVWVLCFCWLDIFWLIAPQLENGVLHNSPMDFGEHACCLLGIGGIFVAYVIRQASAHPVRTMRDPRMDDALAYQNF